MKKKELSELKEMDAIALRFGFDFLRAVVIGNSGDTITWYSDNFPRSYARTHLYKEIEAMGWDHIGTYRRNFIGRLKLNLIK